MTDQLLLVSRIALLALIYLVFLRVARAVIVEVRAETRAASPMGIAPRSAAARVPASAATATRPTTAPAPPVTSGPAGHQLTVVAPSALAGTSFALESETTIGRAQGCAVSIDDARVSKLHARVFADGGQWVIEDLGSTNGTSVNGRPLAGPLALNRHDRVQVGEVTLEFS